MNLFKNVMIVSVVLAVVGALNACGTVRGVGKDVSTVGKGIQRAAH